MRRLVVLVMLALAYGSPESAGSADRGVAELSLDAAAVMALLEAGLPEPFSVEIPGLGALTLRPGPVRHVAFDAGDVVVTLGFVLDPPGLGSEATLRYRPETDPLLGEARLVPRRVTLAGLPDAFDLADALGPLALPRAGHWTLPLDQDRRIDLVWTVQRLEVTAERLVVALALLRRNDRAQPRLRE